MIAPATNVVGTSLFKAVPRGSPVSGTTAYWMTADQAQIVARMSVTEASSYLGLPAAQTYNALANGGFDYYMIAAKQGQAPTVFTSKVAPTLESLFTQPGGAVQTIVPNRSIWTDAVKIDPKVPGSLGPVRKGG